MKKILTIGAGILGVGLATALGYNAVSSRKFSINRTTTIDADIHTIFNHIADFKQWHLWSPWVQLDPQLNSRITGSDKGEGAVYVWDGNKRAGSGKLIILSTTDHKMIEMVVHFYRPFTAKYKIYFHLEPLDNGEVRVTWRMDGELAVIPKLMSLIQSLDKTLGEKFAIGLQQLKYVCEQASKTVLSIPEETEQQSF